MAKVPTSNLQSPASKLRPYAPSWVDRLIAWLDRLPGPTWLYYAGMWLVLFSLRAVVFWVEGYPVGSFVLAHGFIAGMMPFFLALFRYLDNKAGAALADLRPALETSESQYRVLHFQLTTLPARPTLLVSLIGVAFVVLITDRFGAPVSFEVLAGLPVSSAFTYCMYLIAWWVFSAFMYHTVHQLRVINRIYTRHTRVNLFRMKPLYAFSGVAALTAVSLTLPTYVWLGLNPGLLTDPTTLAITLPIAVLALVAFVWPMLGIHRLLVEEKERLLGEIALRSETAMVELLQRVDGGELEGMSDLSEAIVSLETEQKALKGIPTWPWQPETVRSLITALLLPLGLWMAQYVLQRLLGP